MDFAKVLTDGEFKSIGNISQNKIKQLAFVESEKYLPLLLECPNISCIVTTEEIAAAVPDSLGVLVSNNPRISFYQIHNFLAQKTAFYGIPTPTFISRSSKIHPRAYVAESNVKIGERCYIGPNAMILENSILEDDIIVRAGSIIGTEGFRFERIGNEILPIMHAGGVLIHRGVEIQANSCIATAKFGGDFTEIGEYTKIDNLVHIAHNVVIGKRCAIIAGAIVAGSTVVGDDVWIGPNACISDQLRVGNNSFITMGSIVTKDVPSGQRVTGNFAIDHRKFIEFLKSIA